MTLKDRIVRLIQSGGPIPISTYMQLALHDSKDGYYATRPGLGTDFTTAPEMSQIFGELLGLWAVHEWKAMGSPAAFQLVEIGPGRGVLMDDALRLAAIAGGPDFIDAMTLILIEPSPELRKVQSERLPLFSPQFADTLGQVADDVPTLILANEYLDCLPARQFRRDGEAWRECVVGLDDKGELGFGLASDDAATPDRAPAEARAVEVQPSLDIVIADLAVKKSPYRALFIDYGPSDVAPSDSLRSFREMQQISPLEAPGESDLTVDVDFGRFARLAQKAGIHVAGPVPQGMFLLGMGAQARLNQLVKANEDDADAIFQTAQRLIDPKDMGERFKVICLSSAGLPAPAGL